MNRYGWRRSREYEFTIDDKVLKDILLQMYYPQSPYEFSILPPEILGSVYERFLGKAITLTKSTGPKFSTNLRFAKQVGSIIRPLILLITLSKTGAEASRP